MDQGEKVAAKNRPPEDHQGFMIPLPQEPVAVGEKWKDKFQTLVKTQQRLTQRIDMMRIYQLKSVEGDLAKIGFHTAILTPVNDGGINGQLIQKQTEGYVVLDMRQGLLVEKNINVDRIVINPFGPGSRMHAVTKLVEKVVPGKVVADNSEKTSDPATAAK